MYYIILTLLLGFVAYWLSIYTYIKAQRELGAARTSAYYAAAPFIGVLASWMFLQEQITWSFFVALIIMFIGIYFAISEKHNCAHVHEVIIHEHKHLNDDGHHNYTNENGSTAMSIRTIMSRIDTPVYRISITDISISKSTKMDNFFC